MAGDYPWDYINWLNAIQTLLLLGGFLLNGASNNREANAQEIQNLLTISEHHREVWARLLSCPELERILEQDADAETKPLTRKEEESINLVIVQFLKSWRIAKCGGLVTLKELAVDVQHFISLPLPRAVWEKTKQFRNPRFVRFVERALEADGRLRPTGA